MSCQNCKSDRILSINGKCSDLFSMNYGEHNYDGYVPEGIVIGDGGYGDYIGFSFCLDCGRIQGKFPISESKVISKMKVEEEE